jgi:hypothetical protein
VDQLGDVAQELEWRRKQRWRPQCNSYTIGVPAITAGIPPLDPWHVIIALLVVARHLFGFTDHYSPGLALAQPTLPACLVPHSLVSGLAHHTLHVRFIG